MRSKSQNITLLCDLNRKRRDSAKNYRLSLFENPLLIGKNHHIFVDNLPRSGYSKKYQEHRGFPSMEHKHLIDKALRYIEAHLRDELLLEDIATRANFSAWHFHRVFYAVIGLTVGEYIRKRRLSEASFELLNSPRPILQIARDYRFESQAAFTRSFKSFCGCTPGKMRRHKLACPCFQPRILISRKGVKMQEPRIIHKDNFHVVGINCRSTMRNNTIPALWDSFNRTVCAKIPAAKDMTAALGVCYYEDIDEMTADTPFTYLAGFELSMDHEIPSGLEARTVPAADYAVFEHHGSLDTLHDTYNAIYNDWMPQSAYERLAADDFELYDERFKFGEPDSLMEIWVPVKKK